MYLGTRWPVFSWKTKQLKDNLEKETLESSASRYKKKKPAIEISNSNKFLLQLLFLTHFSIDIELWNKSETKSKWKYSQALTGSKRRSKTEIIWKSFRNYMKYLHIYLRNIYKYLISIWGSSSDRIVFGYFGISILLPWMRIIRV